MSSYFFSPTDLPKPKPGQNPLYDHYQAMAGNLNAAAPRVQIQPPRPIGIPGQQAQAPAPGVAPAVPAQDDGASYRPPAPTGNAYQPVATPQNKAVAAAPAFQGDAHDPHQRLSAILGGQGDPLMASPGNNPQMMPDPSKQLPQIGVPSNGQVQSGPIGVQRQPNWGNTRDIENATRQSLKQQYQDAFNRRDHAGMADVAAQREAWLTGGPLAHAQYMQQRDLVRSQTQKNGTQSGGLPKGPDGLMDPEAARVLGMKETNSAAGGDAFAQNARIANYGIQEGQGKQIRITPADAPAIIASRATHLDPLVKMDGDKPAMTPQKMLRGAKQRDPSVFEKPGSIQSQAFLEMMRQLHGEDISKRLAMPADPAGYMPSGSGYLGQIMGPVGRATTGAAMASLDNLFHWRDGVADPWGQYASQQEANDLFNALQNPTKK